MRSLALTIVLLLPGVAMAQSAEQQLGSSRMMFAARFARPS